MQPSQDKPKISLDQVLSHGSVPTLPVVALQLLEMTSNPDVALKEISELIQSDPGLASKVLKTVNSSFYGLPKPCPSIERAIVILGLKAIKSLVLGFSMVNLTKGMDDSLDLSDFWKHTILAAVGARQIAQTIGMPEPDEVFAAALMQDIGVLAMLAVNTELYAPVLAETANTHSKLLDLEREQLGIDHIQVGAAMAEKWRMPMPIVFGIRHHHDKAPPQDENETLIKCIVAGELATNAITEHPAEQAFTVFHSAVSEWFGQDEQDIEALFNHIHQSSGEVAKLLDQQIGEVPSAQELMNRASERLFETQLQTQREADQAKHDAMTDGLTGVPNRAHYDQVIVDALADAFSNQQPIAVLFSDADKFKFVNDTYGHPCGDAVLVELAKRVSETVGERGTVCRYGGEEFVVVLPGLDTQAGAAVGEEIRKNIADTPFDMAGVAGAPDEPLPRTVSVGVASWKPGDEQPTAEQLTQRADKAVYTAKESGRNNVKSWGVDAGRRASDRRADEAAALGISLDAVPSGGRTQILLIEDDPLAARLIQSMLEKQPGVSVELKTDGRAAVEYMRDCQAPGRSNPDLIISDINIPGYNGLQIIRALRSNVKFQQIPIVVVTATLDDAIGQSCLDAGANSIYNKLEISADLKNWCSELIRSMSTAA
ncbi:MAG: HDOD domain-containing protein [Phycisphaeraceae bacterium]|nr:HDOD domain-containing protein [Phycisphaeraceae bacterium]